MDKFTHTKLLTEWYFRCRNIRSKRTRNLMEYGIKLEVGVLVLGISMLVSGNQD